MNLDLVTIVVDEYDPAIDFFVDALGFELAEDSPSLIAPRGLLIMENPHIDWLGARSGSVAALVGAEVCKALGAEDNITYWSDIQDGNHCATRSEWRAPLRQSIEAFLLGTGDAPGQIRISPSRSGNLSEWRNWQTPVLTGGGGDPGSACTADYRTVNSWSGGFQGEVSVRNSSTSALNGWTVTMSLAPGQSISNLWNGENTGSGESVTVRNTPWNGTVAVAGTAAFGFVSTGSSSTEPDDITCTSP